MVKASGTRVAITFEKETTRNVVNASPSMTRLRVITRRIGITDDTLESQEVDPDRQVVSVRGGFRQVAGSFDFELSRLGFDPILEMSLGGTWTGIADGAVDLGAVASTQLFTRASGSFITDGYSIGDFIVTAAFSEAANNGTHQVTEVLETTLKVSTALVDETAAAGPTLALIGSKLKVGTALETATIERRFEDVNLFQHFTGCTFDWSLSVQPSAIIGGTLDVLGIAGTGLSGTSIDATPTAAPTHDPYSSFEGEILLDATTLGCVTSMDWTVRNNRSLQACIGSRFSDDVYDGICRIEGSLTLFFEDAVAYNKFIEEEDTTMWLRLDDPDGVNFMAFVFPRAKLTGAEIDPPAEGPVPLTLSFTAIKDPASGSSLIIQRSIDS